MASELSSFIEDELRKQGINDDEEQRLLSNLRVKPLSVQAPGGAARSGWTTKRKAAVVIGLAVLFGALVALVINYRGHPLTTEHFRGAIVDPEAGVEAMLVDEHASAKAAFEAEAERLEKEEEARREREEAAEAAAEGHKSAHKAAAGEGGQQEKAKGKQQEAAAPEDTKKGNATEAAAGDKAKESAAGEKKQEGGGRRRLLRS